MLLKIFKIVLMLCGVLLLGLLLVGAVLVLNWPWWTALFLILGLIGLVVGGLFIRKIWLRNREQQFLDQVIKQDDLRIRSLADKEREQSQELQNKWKEAIETLKRSHLKKKGNPLYVLPWYLVLGESGSGKTTSIQSAGLTSPFAEYKRVGGISGTRNCDWWFFDSSIILDTAGRYAMAVDEERDKEEWREFLPLLAKYRKREPLNGLIVTIAADKLLSAGTAELQQDGVAIRNRINELMLALGMKFPVYLLVTKCDLIQGMTQFCDHLPEAALNQAMGCVNEDFRGQPNDFVSAALHNIDERLRNLRLLLLHQPKTREVDPALLLFPDEFAKLKGGLQAFIQEAFQDNPYQEKAIFRGVFFSSGRQEGTPYSHFLKNLGLLSAKDVLPGTNRGLFLHDFFAKILPKDRRLFAPTMRSLEWNRLTRNLGLTSWVTLLLALCGLLSFSFVKNLAPLRQVPVEFLHMPQMQGELLSDLGLLERYRKTVADIERANENWWIPRFGLNESLDVEEQFKTRFSEQFKHDFLTPRDQLLSSRIDGFNVKTDDQVIADHVTLLIRRIDLLQARLDGEEVLPLAESDPAPFAVLLPAGAGQLPDAIPQTASLYGSYLLWNQNENQLQLEKNELKQLLKKTIAAKGNSLQWLVAWANQQPDLAAVTLGQFWLGELTSQGKSVMVPPAYTQAGKERIDAFLKEMEEAFADSGVSFSGGPAAQFITWYRQTYFEAWRQFAGDFSKGDDLLHGLTSRRQMAQMINSEQGPYWAFLDRMAEELLPMTSGENTPVWVKQLFRIQLAKNQAALGAGQEQGFLGKAGQEGRKLLDRISQVLGKTSEGGTLQQQDQAAKSLQSYRAALDEVSALGASRRAAFDMASAAFTEDPVASKASFHVAYRSLASLRRQLGIDDGQKDVISKLVQGPFDYLWGFVVGEAGCMLQNLWESEVLAEIRGLNEPRAIEEVLFGADGFAKNFAKGTAGPFLGRSRSRGYYPKRVLGREIAFQGNFLSFLGKGSVARPAVLSNYTVRIEGLPTEANRDAIYQPHATHLELQCGGQSTRLDNFQFRVVENFVWSPDDCSDVLFQIEVGNLVLTKRYSGDQAFPSFLKDFSGGEKIFRPDDFAGQSSALKSMGINMIKVKYQFTGDKKVLEQVRPTLGSVPSSIVRCVE